MGAAASGFLPGARDSPDVVSQGGSRGFLDFSGRHLADRVGDLDGFRDLIVSQARLASLLDVVLDAGDTVAGERSADGCELALPVISESNDHLMTFHSWQAETRLGKNRYGIFEPQDTAAVPVSSLDIILMPLVGYDRFGNRLGMGGGYYDRCLKNLRDQVKPLRTGIAYGLQEISPVDKNIWDISLHGVVNEHGWFTFVS